MSVGAGGRRGPLRTLRVLVSGGSRAALLTGALLADWGADVVLLEPDGGHSERRVLRGAERSALWWASRARNLRSVRVLETESELALGLARAADVLVDDLSSACPGAWGENLVRARAENPGLVTLMMSPEGTRGPDSRAPSDEICAEASAGLAEITGDPDAAPLHSDYTVSSAASALMGAVSAMSLVYRRNHGTPGRGGHAELAHSEVLTRILDFISAFHDQLGWVAERNGSTSPYQVPTNRWQTSDGVWMSFTGNTQGVVERFLNAIERPDLVSDPRFDTNVARVANRDELERVIGEYFATHTYAQADASMQEHGVPIAPILAMDRIFEDPQYAARGVLVEVPTTDGVLRMPGAAVRFSRTPGEVRSPGPALDADRAAVLSTWTSRAPGRVSAPETAGTVAPLAGLRVIDNGNVIAGPLTATLMADLGADVVKVERPVDGDLFRRQAPLKDGHSVWWSMLGRGKRSIALDLKDEADRQTFMSLTDAAQVVVGNFVPGVAAKLGIDAAALLQRNPNLVAIEISGYGQSGPISKRRAFGRNAEAFCGMANLTGYPGERPQHTGFPVADAFSAMFGVFGSLAALYERDEAATGGQSLDIALFESVFRFLEPQAALHHARGEVWMRGTAMDEPGLWRRVLPTEDERWVTVSAPSDEQRAAVAQVLGCTPGELADPGVDLAAFSRDFTATELLEAAHRQGVAAALNVTVAEVIGSPQNRARKVFEHLEDPQAGRILAPAVIPEVDGNRLALPAAAPALDQHRGKILAEWAGVQR
ncbi:CaiB/BaiF CoA transferase family protein [Nocardioides sp. Bht2]|uniref:CaiB/BaiF CoA transferase family protein n=1 Tax=Nocardioides sp. Bht2 TaxID=3392297 RepID=UPI0039B686A6